MKTKLVFSLVRSVLLKISLFIEVLTKYKEDERDIISYPYFIPSQSFYTLQNVHYPSLSFLFFLHARFILDFFSIFLLLFHVVFFPAHAATTLQILVYMRQERDRGIDIKCTYYLQTHTCTYCCCVSSSRMVLILYRLLFYYVRTLAAVSR